MIAVQVVARRFSVILAENMQAPASVEDFWDPSAAKAASG
jgi:hypothetical protein